MASLPTDEEIRARAEQLKLIGAGEPLPANVRRAVAKALQDEQKAPPAPRVLQEPVLLSRSTQPALGGLIRIDVLFIPNQEG